MALEKPENGATGTVTEPKTAEPGTESTGGNTPPKTEAKTDNGSTGTKTETAPTAFKTFADQKAYDDEAARIRGAAERAAEAKLLASLGLSTADAEKLEAMKTAYQSSLTDGEKKDLEMTNLKTENQRLENRVKELEAVTAALSVSTGTTLDEIDKVVKMAGGLVSETVTIEQAVKDVLALMQPKTEETKPTPPVGGPGPEGAPAMKTQNNPFAKATWNLTEQGRIMRENPAEYERLKREAAL